MRQEMNVLGNQVIVNLYGSLYVEEASVLRKNLLSYIDKGYKDFLVNMAELEYIDSSGLGVLVGIQKRSIERGGGIIISGLKGTVKELFELTRLTKVFEVR